VYYRENIDVENRWTSPRCGTDFYGLYIAEILPCPGCGVDLKLSLIQEPCSRTELADPMKYDIEA
jgi:hypothetical protein